MRRFAVAGALLALGALLPAGVRADDGGQKYYYEDILMPFFAPDPDRPGWYRASRPNAKVGAFLKKKPANGFRVFVIGGSIAGLLQHEDGPGDLGPALKAALPGREVEVLNCGMAGYETRREALVEQEILEYQPDLIVMLTGHNEGLASAPIPLWVMRAQERLSRIDAYRSWVKRLRRGGNVEKHSNERSDARDADFARQLGENLRRARERGVPVALVIPPRNYREPSETANSFFDADFVPGWIKFLRGDWSGARAFWRASLETVPARLIDEPARKAFTWGFIARAEEKLGLWKESRESFEAASRHERSAICGVICQGILRAAAAKEGAFLVEGDRRFRKLAEPRMPGLDFFNDRMHWKPRYNCHVSAEVIAAARAEPRLASLPWNAEAIGRLESFCAKTGSGGDEDDDERILGYVLMGMSWPELPKLSPVAVFYLESLRRTRPQWFKDVAALAARGTNPQQVYGIAPAPSATLVPRFLWHIAATRMLEKDHAGALADLTKALERDSSMPWVRVEIATAEALRGDRKKAEVRFAEAVARASGPHQRAVVESANAAAREFGLGEAAAASDPEHWYRVADSAREKGRREEALAALAKVYALKPKPEPELLRRLGTIHLRLLDDDGYLAISDRLVELFPDQVDLWAGRAESLFAKGRLAEGKAALDKAASLNPGPSYVRYIGVWRAWLADGARPDRLPR